MLNDEYIEIEGNVIASLPNAMFRVKLENGIEIVCYISGKIRKNSINILPGDKVRVAISKYDVTKGRITYRFRK